MARALHLVQLFSASGVKNGADIRLAVDAVEDLMRHPEISHVVLVAGDSDYVPLAQSCKQLGRYVVGIGVAGSTSRALVSACNEFIDYAHLPGVTPPPARKRAAKKAPAKRAGIKKTAQRRLRPPPSRGARRGRGHRPARAGDPGRPAEERRRLGQCRRGEEPDAANGSGVQGEVARVHDVPSVRGVAQRPGRVQGRRQRTVDRASGLSQPTGAVVIATL